MFCFAVRVFARTGKLRQQTAFISPPAEAGVFCGNMIKAITFFSKKEASRQMVQRLHKY